MSTAITTTVPHTLSESERQAILQREVAGLAKHGWTVVSQTPTQASLTKGKNTSHGVHIFLSIITLGLWVPVWICLAIFAGKKSKLVAVNDEGSLVTS